MAVIRCCPSLLQVISDFYKSNGLLQMPWKSDGQHSLGFSDNILSVSLDCVSKIFWNFYDILLINIENIELLRCIN